jgi:hypothetical protein
MTHKRSIISIALASIMLVSLCAVYASASVAAAPSTSANVQAPALVGAPVAGAPAVCSRDGKSLDLFVKGTDGALWWKHSDDGTTWSAATSLGGYLTSDPAAASPSSNFIDVFVRGGDGALWSRHFYSGVWGSWYKIGGQLLAGTGPAAYAWGLERTGQFVTGTDHALWHRWMDTKTDTQHDWENLGGYLTSSPAAASPGSGVTDVYARGGDGALWSKQFSATAWGSWFKIGGQLLAGTSPAAYGWSGTDQGGWFVTGTNHGLYFMWKEGTTTSSWINLGGYLTSSPGATARGGMTSAIDVFVRGGDNGLWRRDSADMGNNWSGWTSIGGI